MHLSLQALVLVALSLEGALAQPAHRHQHKHRRDLADVIGEKANLDKRVDWSKVDWSNVDWNEVCAPGECVPAGGGTLAPAASPAAPPVTSPAASPATSPAAAAQVAAPENLAVKAPSSGSSTPASSSVAPVSSPSSSSSSSTSSSGSSTGSCSDLSSVWTSKDSSRVNLGLHGPCDGGCTSADGPAYSSFAEETTATNVGSKDSYIGNVGSPYGHNMYPLTNCDVSGVTYSITFTNSDSSQIQVALWNKVGDDGAPLSGASRNAFFKFPLEAGQSASFAVQENSQVGFSQACDRNTYPGDFGCTWGEADFGDKNIPNNGASGYDRSSIQNGAGNTGILTVCVDGHDCSSQAGNSFVSASQTSASGDLMVAAGQPMHLKVTMG